jgi:polysaccharide export outer membrane protein
MDVSPRFSDLPGSVGLKESAMSHRRSGRELAGYFLLCALFAGGCQSTGTLGSMLSRDGSAAHPAPTASAPKAQPTANNVVLAPGMEIEWHIKAAQEGPGLVRMDKSTIGPDGVLVLGPYGSCKVGGLTLAQARVMLEKHLAQYIRGPAVTIGTQVPADVAWRPAAKTPAPAAVAKAAAAPAKAGSAVKAVSFQTTKDKEKEKDGELIGAPRAMLPPAGPVVVPPEAALHAGPVPVPGPPAANECKRVLMPPYVIGPTDVLQIESLQGLPFQRVAGPHLVGPDGFVRVGIYGPVPVAGLTVDQAKLAIAQAVFSRLEQAPPPKEKPEVPEKPRPKLNDVVEGVSVDVLAYNSKVFYVIADGAGLGEQVIILPFTGNDTVLDAIGKINGLPIVASKHHIQVARRNCPGHPETVLPVDWVAITQRGDGLTNWQIMPGDRVYIHADVVRTIDNQLAKILSPIERLFGVTLLASQTVNSIKSGSVGGTR